MAYLRPQGHNSNRSLSASSGVSRSLSSSPSRSLCSSPSPSPSRSLSSSPCFTFSSAYSQDDMYTNSRMCSQFPANEVCHRLVPHSKHQDPAHKIDEDLGFAVAADLTLYANPLRCLKKTAKPAVVHATSGENMVAADLVKYGSPLDQ